MEKTTAPPAVAAPCLRCPTGRPYRNGLCWQCFKVPQARVYCKRLNGRPPCVHCGIRPQARARGLCWTCSSCPTTRGLYSLLPTPAAAQAPPPAVPVPPPAPQGLPDQMRRCVNCCRDLKTGPRRLCSRCYKRPDVRAKFPPKPLAGTPCRAGCGRRANRPRGLCWTCYYHVPGAREAFPTESKHGRRGEGNQTGAGRVPVPAADVAPGSLDKLTLMARRAAAGEQLFHPDEPRLAPPVGSSWGRAVRVLGPDVREMERDEEVMRALVG